MKRLAFLPRTAAFVAAISIATTSVAIPPPGAPGGPDAPDRPGQPPSKKPPQPGARQPGAPAGPSAPGAPRGPGGPINPVVPRAPGVIIPRGPEPMPPHDPRRPMVPFFPRVPPPPPVEPAPSYSESMTGQVQRKLKKLGYYQGTVDGELGRGTRSAIRDFQDENSLEVTGQIDRSLIRALGL